MSEYTAYFDPDVDAIRSNMDNTFISDVLTNFSKIENSPRPAEKKPNIDKKNITDKVGSPIR